jgi:hypothetical protein
LLNQSLIFFIDVNCNADEEPQDLFKKYQQFANDWCTRESGEEIIRNKIDLKLTLFDKSDPSASEYKFCTIYHRRFIIIVFV